MAVRRVHPMQLHEMEPSLYWRVWYSTSGFESEVNVHTCRVGLFSCIKDFHFLFVKYAGSARMNPNDYEALEALEESLWQAETRFDRGYMEQVLAPDFFEFGRSGRRYTREEALAVAPAQIRAKLPLDLLDIKFIQQNVALITYVSEVEYESLERANRCSVWVRAADQWRLQFHQGTPV